MLHTDPDLDTARRTERVLLDAPPCASAADMRQALDREARADQEARPEPAPERERSAA